MKFASLPYGAGSFGGGATPVAGKTLVIAGVDFLPQYRTGSAHIRETVQNKSNVMNLDIIVKPTQSVPREGSEIIFRDGVRYLFGGYISRIQPTETGEGQLFNYAVEASDYSYILNNKVARRAYTNKTLAYIVGDLMSAYVDASYGFTVTNVATGPTIDSITFDHISIRKCLEKLQKLTGYVWWVDYEKNLFFKLPSAQAAPEQITDTSDNFQDIAISYDTSQVRNAVTVIGSDDGEQSATTVTQTFTGDGATRAWELDDKPSSISSITINGVSKQFSLDVNERDTDVFTYSFTGQSFRLTDAQTTPTGGDTIVITYYPRIPIIVEKEDEDSIAFFAAKDGGDGVYEHTVKEPSITSKATATERALQELDEFAMPLVNGQFTTRTSLLDAGSLFSPGQYLTVNLPTYDIDADAAFLIQEVNITMEEDRSGTTEYLYRVRFGGKLTGVREFLESLASETAEVQNVDQILTLEKLSEAMEVADQAPTHELFTPPFIYGPWPAYRVPLTIAAGKVTADLTAFPVYVDLSTMADHFFDNVKADGGDIRVTLSDGKTQVPVEVVAIDTALHTGEVWFKADLLTASDNLFYVHYGNASMSLPAAASTYGSQNVWTGHNIVLHLQASASDSTGNVSPGTVSGATLTSEKIGKGYSLVSASSQNIAFGNVVDKATNSFSMSFWVRTTNTGTLQSILSKKTDLGSTVAGYAAFFENNKLRTTFADGVNPVLRRDSSTNLASNTLHKVRVEWDYSTKTVSIYINGVLNQGTQSGTVAGSLSTTQQLRIGTDNGSRRFLNGGIDEVRVSGSTLGASYEAADYANQNSPSTFYTVGTYLRSRVGRYNKSEWA